MRSGRRASYIWGAVGLAWSVGIFGWAYALRDAQILLCLLSLTGGLVQLVGLGTTSERLSRGQRARLALLGSSSVVFAFSVLVQHPSLAWFGRGVVLLALVSSFFARRVLDGRWWGEAPSAQALGRQS
jgi:hypothetical protein